LIGREAELERTIQILARRTKNNPVLIGETGVGKNALVHGPAPRIADGAVPAMLEDRSIPGNGRKLATLLPAKPEAR
jgi:ATP-dependent Clp protease ATP-binding subunit ClpA